jgi:hypothetical protein
VDGGDATVLDLQVLMDYFYHWGKAVGGAAGCCDYDVLCGIIQTLGHGSSIRGSVYK